MWALETLCEPLWQRLTWTLLHFLWQGLAVAAVAATLLRAWPVRRARNRYVICLLALLAMAACPLVTFVLVEVPESATASRDQTEPQVEVPAASESGPELVANETRVQLGGPAVREPQPALARSETVPQLATESPALGSPHVEAPADLSEPVTWRARLRQGVGAIQPYALIVWIAGVLALAARLSISWLHVRWLAWGRLAIPTDLAAKATTLGCRLGLRFPPRVCVSEKIREAIVVGLWRPLVLLPASWITEMTPEVLEAVIAHELAHIRRWDLWVNLLQRLVEMLLFYHPAVWWLSRRVGLEREMCTDELAVGVTNKRMAYATALEQLGRMRLGQSAPQFGASVGDRKMVLLDRVGNILGLSASDKKARWWPVALMALAVPLGLWFAFAQNSSAGSSDALAAEETCEPAMQKRIEELLDVCGRREGGIVNHTTLITFDTDETRELAAIGRPVVRPLVKALKDPNKHIRRHAAFVLGKLGDRAALEPLLECCRAENTQHAKSGQWDNDVFEPAAWAVTKLLFPEHANDHNWLAERAGTIYALTRGSYMLESTRRAEMEDFWRQYRRKHPTVFTELEDLDEEFRAAITDAVEKSSPAHQRARYASQIASLKIGFGQFQEWWQLAEKTVPTDQLETFRRRREELLGGIASRGPAVVPQLMPTAYPNPQEYHRFDYARDILKRIGPSALPAMKEALKSPRRHAPNIVWELMAEIPGPEAEAVLRVGLGAKERSDREHAFWGLIQRGDIVDADTALAFLDSESPAVLKGAIDVLVQLGDRRALDALQEIVLKYENDQQVPERREAAEKAKGAIEALRDSGARAAWGNEVEGLQLGLAFNLQDRPYLVGETVGFRLLVRNNSAKPTALIDFEPLMGWMPTVRGADGKRLFVNGEWDGQVRRREQVVAPGKTIVVGGVSLRLDEPWDGPSNDPPHILLEPGKYFVRQTYRFEEDPEATFSGELTSGELALTVAEDTPWGEAVEGVRTRLRGATQIWGRSDWAHSVVRLTVDARNDGQHRLHLHRNGETWQVEVDGVWYERFPNPGGARSDFEAGRKYDNMTLELAGGWRRIPKGKEVKYAGHLYGPGRVIMGEEYGEVLQLTPSKHRLRVAITLPPLFPGRSEPIRTVSNPIEIEIGPTKPTADSLTLRETKHVGSVVPPRVELRTEAPGLSAEEVESLVTGPLENALSGTSSLQTISSKSLPGVSTVVLVFQHDTDLLRARQLVQERLTMKAPRLPAVARSPVILPPLSSTNRVSKTDLSQAIRVPAAGAGPARDVVEKWLALIREGNRDDAARLMARGKNENADDVLSMTVLLEAASQGNVVVKATHVGPNVALVISKPMDEGRNVGQSYIFHLIHAVQLGPEWRITEVSLVRPEEIAVQLEAFHAKPVDRPVNARGFGPMLERTVQRTSKHTTALDLDADRLLRVPNDFDTNRNVTQDPIKWLVVRGIDVMPQCNPNRQAELTGLGGMLQKVRQVENKLWDESDAAQVRKLLAASKQGMGMQLRASDGSYPVTYVFETFPQPTGESRQGVLQVLAVDQNEQTVKLRYQLVGALRNAEGVKAWPPDAVKAVFESLRSELVEIGTDYPEFAGARDIRVAHRELFYGTDYRHNCTVLQRGCRDDGPNAAYFRFEIYSLPKDGDPFPFATTPPAHRWPALNLVGWSNVYVGKNSSPGVEAKVRDILRRHVAMIDHIASEPRENQVDIAAEELGSGVFGPVMERVVTEQPSKSTTYLDLDTGKYTDPEPDTIVASTGWLRAHGVDLYLSGYESERTLRTTADMALRKLRDSAFRESSHWTVGEAQAVLRNLEGPTSARVIGTPCVFAFRTREGSVGIMQLLPPPEDKPEVTVRYKLLKKSKEADKFAIYLVEGRVPHRDLHGDLSKLTLASKPILTLEDVLAVDATGGIYLRETARWLLFADSGWEPDNRSKPEEDLKLQEREQRRAIGRGGPRTLGQQDPYVLVLDGKRVLAGRIMSLVSSPMIQAIHYAEPARPVRIGVFDEQRKDLLDVLRREGKEMRWGEAVRSVQCGLRADRTRWKTDETPTLAVGVRNREPAYRARSLELELDGQWYQFKDPGTSGTLRAHIIPGELFQFGSGQDTNVGQFRLFEGIWQRKADSGESNPTGEEDQMRLTPGKHVIRVAFVVEYSGGGRDEPLLRALSNRAEIEIVAEEPLEAAATSTEAEGPSSKTAAPPAPSEKSAVPPARFTPVMQRIIWIGSSGSFMLDLDTGKTRGKPKAPETGHGMDIWPDRDEAEMGPYDVVCRGVKGVVVSSDQWDVTPAELIRTLSDPNLKDLPKITHNSKEVTTAFVKTSEGGMGVLKLHGAIAAGDLPDRPVIFYRMLVDDRPKAGWGPPADGVQARLRATKRTWKAGEPPSLEVDLENTGSRPLSFPRNYTYWHLQVDGRWYVHRLGGSGSELPNLFGGDHYEKLPLSFAGDWRLAEKEEIGPNYRSGFHTRIPDDRPRLKLAAGKHTVRVAVTAESARASTGGPLWVESNPAEIEIVADKPPADAEKAAVPSAEANVPRPPASPQDAKALLQQLNSGTLSDEQIRQITDDALAVQGDLKQEWDPVWGNWLEVARLQGKVSDADFERYAKQSNPVWQFEANEAMEKRSGKFGLSFSLRHVGGRVTSKTTNHGLIISYRLVRLRVNDVPIDWRGNAGEWTFTAKTGHGSGIFREPSEIQGIEKLIPGKHEAVLLIEGEIYEADHPEKMLHRWKATLKDEIELHELLMPWGPAVQGVQVRLWSEKRVWRADEVPVFKACIRNRGERDLMVQCRASPAFALEVDGKWHAPVALDPIVPSPFGPGQEYRDIQVQPDKYSTRAREIDDRMLLYALRPKVFVDSPKTSDDEPLRLSPGKHWIRMALRPQGKTLRDSIVPPLSNPIEIEIVADKPPPDAEKATAPSAEVYQKHAANLVLPLEVPKVPRKERIPYPTSRTWLRDHLAGAVPHLLETLIKYRDQSNCIPAVGDLLFEGWKQGLLTDGQKQTFIESHLSPAWEMREAYPPGYAGEIMVMFHGVLVEKDADVNSSSVRPPWPFRPEGLLKAEWRIELDGKEIRRGETGGNDGYPLQLPADLKPGNHQLKAFLEVSERAGPWRHRWTRSRELRIDPELKFLATELTVAAAKPAGDETASPATSTLRPDETPLAESHANGQGAPHPIGTPVAIPDRPKLRELVDREELVHGYWISESTAKDVFFFKGDSKSLNRFLEELASLKETPRTLIIHPGRAPAQVPFREEPVRYDWKLESSYRGTFGDPPRKTKNRQSDYATTVEVWLGGSIESDKLEIPKDIDRKAERDLRESRMKQ